MASAVNKFRKDGDGSTLSLLGDGRVVVEEVDDEGGGGGERGQAATTSLAGELAGYHVIPRPLAKFLVTTGVGIYLKMLLVDNLMHADLHPGNIMIDIRHRGRHNVPTPSQALIVVDDKKKETVGVNDNDNIAITLVDAGMVAQLTDEESAIFIGLLASLGEGNGKEAGEFALRFSLDNSMTREERDAFIADMIDLFAERCRGYGTGVDVGDVLRGVLGIIRKHKVRIGRF
jgi:aarF domain-containing kinase